ncbi:MAG: hypothetical protein IT204_08545 [Fimbriimonadaceae bacterium]|nr:hypothetical protein [Fimbriimonadaceae bacterium]
MAVCAAVNGAVAMGLMVTCCHLSSFQSVQAEVVLNLAQGLVQGTWGGWQRHSPRRCACLMAIVRSALAAGSCLLDLVVQGRYAASNLPLIAVSVLAILLAGWGGLTLAQRLGVGEE